MGPWDGWLGYRYSTPPGHPPSHHPGYTPPAPGVYGYMAAGSGSQVNSAVGLKSVAQLSLGTRFSEIQGITEVYNLVRIGNNNNHFLIPGND